MQAVRQRGRTGRQSARGTEGGQPGAEGPEQASDTLFGIRFGLSCHEESKPGPQIQPAPDRAYGCPAVPRSAENGLPVTARPPLAASREGRTQARPRAHLWRGKTVRGNANGGTPPGRNERTKFSEPIGGGTGPIGGGMGEIWLDEGFDRSGKAWVRGPGRGPEPGCCGVGGSRARGKAPGVTRSGRRTT